MYLPPENVDLVEPSIEPSVVALLGPRESGKTTLARQFIPAESLNYFDLEDAQSLARLTEPDTALHPLKGLVVIVVGGDVARPHETEIAGGHMPGRQIAARDSLQRVTATLP